MFDSDDVANGCILRFEITAGDGGVHKGTILVDQSNRENGVWFYSVTLAETDTGLVLVKNGEYDGGCILTLPDDASNKELSPETVLARKILITKSALEDMKVLYSSDDPKQAKELEKLIDKIGKLEKIENDLKEEKKSIEELRKEFETVSKIKITE